jgi:hypothetical protein
MTQATTTKAGAPRNDESSEQHKHDVTKLREAAKQIGVHRLGDDGGWFQRAVAKHVRKHLAASTAERWDTRYPGVSVEDRATQEIRRVALKASAAGVLASTGASTGEILALVTDGMAAPVGLPAAILSMTLEAAYTSLLQVDLACDVASIYGVPFDADDVGEVTTLFGLAFDVDMKKRASHRDETQHEPETEGLTRKLQELEEGEVAKRIGRKLIEEAVVRNVVPFLGIPVSARWNYVATKRLGKTVKKYVRYRRALVAACSGLRLDTIGDPSMLVEGAWLLATTDGDAGHEEVMALALIMDQLPEARRRAIELDKSLGDDEEDWFDALSKAPAELLPPMLDVFYLIAATDREIQASERRFLRRVGRTIGRAIDFDRLDRICRHLADGEDLPPGMLHCR